MSFDAHKNFAYSTVATAPSPATSGTSLVVAAGDGAKFPAAPFNATIWPTSSQPTTANAEIVTVTAVSTDTLTITRAQEGTVARTVIVGDQISATITAKTLTDVEIPGVATHYIPVNDTQITRTVVGSGSTSYSSSGIQILTGSTNPSSLGAVYAIGGTGGLDAKSIFVAGARFTIRVAQTAFNSQTGSSYFGFGVVTVAGSGHTYTPKHIGIKITNGGSANGTVALTVGDGSTEATASISTASADNDVWDFFVVVNSSTLVTCYYRQNFGAQGVATVSSNIPTGTGNCAMQFSVSNNSTTSNNKFNVMNSTYIL